jgi:hypothetical protein
MAWPQYTVPDEPRQSSAVSAFFTPDDRLPPRHRTPAIDDRYGLTALEAVDQGAQAVLRLSYAGSLHLARIALT